VDRLIDAGADLTILSSALPWPDVEGLEQERGIKVQVTGPFMMMTRLPILEARPLVVNDDAEIYLAVFRLDATAELGRPITVYAVDLPSDPNRPRFEIARTARRMLGGAAPPPPDLVVGDFNMTRGSASVKALFPGLTHAYDQAGRGYGATFRRGFPLYHLDHTLLSGAVTATDYTLVDLGSGRHLGQWVELAPGPGGKVLSDG
jgi:endonuclease/exonuclease/phosphatase family metal-dependent hydrolase